MKKAVSIVQSDVPEEDMLALLQAIDAMEERRQYGERNLACLGLFSQKINAPPPLYSRSTEFFSKNKKQALEARFKEGVKRVVDAEDVRCEDLASLLDVIQSSATETIVKSKLAQNTPVNDQFFHDFGMSREDMQRFLSTRLFRKLHGRSDTHNRIAKQWQAATASYR